MEYHLIITRIAVNKEQEMTNNGEDPNRRGLWILLCKVILAQTLWKIMIQTIDMEWSYEL